LSATPNADLEFDQALLDALGQSLATLPNRSSVAVALSGGIDSVALALVAQEVCKQTEHPLHFFHVHHGLYAEADTWAAHLQGLAHDLAVPLSLQHVEVAQDSGLGIEAAARQARYVALADLARSQGVTAILLAHHRQDQAETVLLRLLRGAGVLGLGAMHAQALRGDLQLLRPWLDIDRNVLVALTQAYAQRSGWYPVQDPSNSDVQYARGALRAELIPVLDLRWPAWRQTLTRHAKQAQETSQILDEVAAGDWQTLEPDPHGMSFSLQRWRSLSEPRQALVLRYWLNQRGAAMPGERRLAELMRQLRQLHALGHDRELLWQHGSYRVQCVRGRVSLSSG
jgi:tRNA(Ile)-lysidine synthase